MEGIVTLIILVISAIGWIANAVKEQNLKQQQQQRPGQPPKPKRRLQDEIENFLKEVQQEQPVKRDLPPPVVPQRVDPFAQERPVEQQPAPRNIDRPRAETSKKQRQKQNKRASKPKPTSSFNTSPPASSSLTTPSPVGPSQLERYLQTESEQGFSRELQALLSPEQLVVVKQLVAQQALRRSSDHTAVPIAQMLASKQNIRNAFVINEILQPPLALRK